VMKQHFTTVCFQTNALSKASMEVNEERVTLFLYSHETGDNMLKSLCIGKTESPCCFQWVNTNFVLVI
jgi:hypothetical protein